MLDLNYDKWDLINLAAISYEYRVREDNPKESDFERFVGSDNISRFDLTVKTWENTDSIKSSMKVFEEGDYLLVRRSLYASDFRERAPRATFNGLCSGDILTIKENSDRIIDGFLWCILNSSKIWEYIVANASGSITRRIKWPQLSIYQFKLPPKDEQEKILSLFLTLEKQIEQTEEQEKNLVQTKRQILRDLFSDGNAFGTLLKENDFETISFGQVAQHISKRVEPSQTDLEIYVGLEHLDPDNLRIERQGTPADVKGTKLLIWKDDIIFGKRRAYQRKVAVSHFDGICSAHSMVLRAIEKKIDKDFLPYFMQSDAFMDRAVQISEGSLSPTIKWKVLERQEFTIPKQAFQKQLTPVFKQFDKLIYQLRDQNSTLKKLKQKLLDEILG